MSFDFYIKKKKNLKLWFTFELRINTFPTAMANKRAGNHQNGGNKRSRAQNNDDDSNSNRLDPEFGMYRALPISQEKLASVRPDTIPEDAETYLALVR